MVLIVYLYGSGRVRETGNAMQSHFKVEAFYIRYSKY